MFATTFLSLIVGSIVVAFHNVWTGIPLFLTLIGWAQVVKPAIYLTFPAYGHRKLHIPSWDRPFMFVVPGVAFVLLAMLLGYHVRITT